MRKALAASLLLAAAAGVVIAARSGSVVAPVRIVARVGLPRSTPEAQGIPSAAIRAFVDAAEQKIDALHSLMVVRHGTVVAEGWWAPFARDERHMLYSLSKSFTSTAVGMAIAEGRLSLDERVVDAFPQDVPKDVSANLRAMRVRDLLSMSSGHHGEAIDGFPFESPEPLPRLFLALPVAHKPGTHFVYNTPATYMLSAMVQRATGSTVLDYLRPRLFEPLGIAEPTWDADAHGVTLGGYGLSLRTEDIARFGQLYLQKGAWQGRQLLPASWVAAASARQVANGSDPASDWEQGYGYQFWRCRHGFYRGDGAFGQFCIVMPEQDAVVAITSGTGDMGGVMALLWEHVLPAMQAGALPADSATSDALRRKLETLVLAPQKGNVSSRLAEQVSGKRYAFATNEDGIESIALEARGGETTLVLGRDGQLSRLPVGFGGWGRTVVLPDVGTQGFRHMRAGEKKVAASGAWTAEDVYTARLCLQETPYVLTMTLGFEGEQLTLDQELNVAFGEKKRPQIVGRRVKG